jgi:hypothetical protein
MVRPERRVVPADENPVRVSVFMQRWPSPKAMKNMEQIIAKLAPVLRGWGNYFGRDWRKPAPR